MTTHPVDVLEGEHDLIRDGLTVLESAAARLAHGEPVSQTHLLQLLSFFVDFADGVHHAKEEAVVLPVLTELDPRRGEWLASALGSDHNAGRKLVDTMRRNLVAAASGRGHEAGAFADAARLYAQHLRGHIDLENDELYPSMRELLVEERASEVLARFADVDLERLGVDGFRRFERWVRDALFNHSTKRLS